MSIYFRRFVGAVWEAIVMADWESVKVGIGVWSGRMESSESIPVSQLVCRVVSDAAMISASQVLRATIDCLWDPQLIGAPCKV